MITYDKGFVVTLYVMCPVVDLLYYIGPDLARHTFSKDFCFSEFYLLLCYFLALSLLLSFL